MNSKIETALQRLRDVIAEKICLMISVAVFSLQVMKFLAVNPNTKTSYRNCVNGFIATRHFPMI